MAISIHAPAKGATGKSGGNPRHRLHFNPRSREGSDLDTSVVCSSLAYFNPRSREGSDIAISYSIASAWYFNPRSREGSDPLWPEIDRSTTAFQSTLPRRERQYVNRRLL